MTRKEQLARIEIRRARAAEMHLKGHSQLEIARELGVSRSTVSRDLTSTHRRWQESRQGLYAYAMDLELAKVNLIEREAWLAWQRSQDDAVTSKATKAGEGSDAAKRAERSTKTQFGDPRFLVIIKNCIQQRVEMLGLEPPPPPEQRADMAVVRAVLDKLQGDIEFEQFSREQAMKAATPHQGKLDSR